jgi:hypothetical protein
MRKRSLGTEASKIATPSTIFRCGRVIGVFSRAPWPQSCRRQQRTRRRYRIQALLHLAPISSAAPNQAKPRANRAPRSRCRGRGVPRKKSPRFQIGSIFWTLSCKRKLGGSGQNAMRAAYRPAFPPLGGRGLDAVLQLFRRVPLPRWLPPFALCRLVPPPRRLPLVSPREFDPALSLGFARAMVGSLSNPNKSHLVWRQGFRLYAPRRRKRTSGWRIRLRAHKDGPILRWPPGSR